jgi:hypothetical protein
MGLYKSVSVIFTQLHPKVYPTPFNRKCYKFYFMKKTNCAAQWLGLLFDWDVPVSMIVLDRFLQNPSKISIHIPVLFKVGLRQHHIRTLYLIIV